MASDARPGMSRHFRGGRLEDDHVYVALMRERDEARAEAEKLRETLASVGVPLEALRLANRDVPGWLSREAERAIVEATDAIRGALSGGGGQ